MSTWYEKGVFYHIYPFGLLGVSKEHLEDAATNHSLVKLNPWVSHMSALGCNATYIGPLFESSTHGYDTKDYKRIDGRLGDNDDFKNFVSLCHKSDIKVVVDGVFNHTGREFFAFQDIQKNRDQSPYCNWYRGINFSYGSPLGDSFGYEAWQGHYELPCLNLFNSQVKEYLLEVVRYWVKEFDIDGIRLDCANILDFDFMKELRQVANQVKPEFWLMGEVIHGDYSHWVNSETLHSVTNYELHKGIFSGHNDHNYFEIAHTVRRLENVGNSLYTFVDNHDEDRIMSKLRNKKQIQSVYTLLYTLPGIPSIYYGSEWGIEGRRTKYSDHELRPAISFEDEPNLHCELTDFLIKLGHIHHDNPEFHGGNYKELLLTNRQYAFARFGENTAVIIAVNNDDNESVIRIPLPFKTSKAVNLFDGEEIIVSDNRLEVHLGGNQGIVLKIEEE